MAKRRGTTPATWLRAGTVDREKSHLVYLRRFGDVRLLVRCQPCLQLHLRFRLRVRFLHRFRFRCLRQLGSRRKLVLRDSLRSLRTVSERFWIWTS